MPLHVTTRQCERCGASFDLRRPSDPKLFCSTQCYHAHRQNSLDRVSKRFWSKVDMSGDCWVWTGTLDQDGYGQFYGLAGQFRRAHRAAYILTHGPIPDDLSVCHACDNPRCVRPDHLFLGTNHENMQDRDNKKRTAVGDRSGARTHPESRAFGERNGLARLTVDAVREIRKRFSGGDVTKAQLAREFGVNETTIASVVTGKTWREVI